MLQNYVVLETGKPASMHFYGHEVVTKDIFDKSVGGILPKRALVMFVDELNGVGTKALFSTLSDKLANQLKPYIDDKSYPKFTFLITKIGEGWATEFQLRAVPR